MEHIFLSNLLSDSFITGLKILSDPYNSDFTIINFGLISIILSQLIVYFSDKNDKIDNESIKSKAFKFLVLLPPFNMILKSKINQNLKNLYNSVHAKENFVYTKELPQKGFTQSRIMALTNKYISYRNIDIDKGIVSGTVYGSDKNLDNLMTDMFGKFMWCNPLHPDIFPDVRIMEAEVVRMVLSMYNGNSDTCGTMTSGGTESIIMACRAYKRLAVKRGIKRPNMIIAKSAHAAFNKAADYFEMDVIYVECDKITGKMITSEVISSINESTCMIVASAPSFAHGIIDPVEEISNIGIKYKIPVHVDACLGGFLIPFANDAGYAVDEIFDFRLPGVTSISCDTHKYGFAPKGTSVIMYKNKEIRKEQFFVEPDWTGGVYACPTVAGSRPGSLIALTWASMLYFGREGYVKSTREIISTARYIKKEISKIPGLRVMGDPKLSVVGFTSDVFNIFQLNEHLSKGEGPSGRLWCLNVLQFPSSVHLCVTGKQTINDADKEFIRDVKSIAAKLMLDKNSKPTGMAALYGSSQTIPDRSLIVTLASGLLDAWYSTPR